MGDVQFVGDHNDGDAAVVQSLKGVHNFDAGLGTEIARRRVGWASDLLDPSVQQPPKLCRRAPVVLFGGAEVCAIQPIKTLRGLTRTANTMFIKVDFPEPLSPIIAANSPT